MASLKNLMSGNIRQYGMIVALVAIIILFQILTDGILLKPLNVTNLLTQNSYILILAIGMVMVIIAGHIDLSVGSVAAFIGALARHDDGQVGRPLAARGRPRARRGRGDRRVAGLLGRLRRHPGLHRDPVGHAHLPRPDADRPPGRDRGQPAPGLREARQRVPPGDRPGHRPAQPHDAPGACCCASSSSSWTSASGPRSSATTSRCRRCRCSSLKQVAVVAVIMWFAYLLAQYKGLPIVGLVLFALIGIYSFIMNRTVFGRHIYAIGGNYPAAALSGVRTKRVDILVMVNMGMLAALAGMVFAARLTAANPKAGVNFELDAIAAAFIGGAAVTGGVGTVIGAIVGGLVMGVLNNGMSLMGVSVDWQQDHQGPGAAVRRRLRRLEQAPLGGRRRGHHRPRRRRSLPGHARPGPGGRAGACRRIGGVRRPVGGRCTHPARALASCREADRSTLVGERRIPWPPGRAARRR